DVERERQQQRVLAQPDGERARGALAHLAAAIVQQCEHAAFVELLTRAVDLALEGHLRRHLIEQAVEGAPAGVGGVLEQLLLRLAERVRTVTPQGGEMRAIAGTDRVGAWGVGTPRGGESVGGERREGVGGGGAGPPPPPPPSHSRSKNSSSLRIALPR